MDNDLLGMYVHTHWGYNHPYAARSWTLADWQGYLAGLAALDYRFILIWPQFDCMPAEPNESDRVFLKTLSEAIDIAHNQFDMRVALTAAPNTIGNEYSQSYNFSERPYFLCEEKINPKDPAAVAAFLAGRERQFSFVANADALAIIDSDPGGYIGSTNDEFVALMHGQITAFRKHNPAAELIYWMLAGWESYNRFWEKQLSNSDERTQMWDNWKGNDFLETLKLLRQTIPEPWSLFAWLEPHLNAVTELKMMDKVMYYPYGTVEGEPTYPLTHCDPDTIDGRISSREQTKGSRGILANAQTHCLQLPNTYIFAHFARGGTRENLDLTAFADNVLPGHGALIARAWMSITTRDPAEQRAAAKAIRGITSSESPPGKYSGLLFGDSDRFLIDLAMNLELRASMIDMAAAITAGDQIKSAVQRTLDCLLPYQERVGFIDAYGGTMDQEFNQQLVRLDAAGINEVLALFSDWRDPAVRHGIMPRLLTAVQDWCNASADRN